VLHQPWDDTLSVYASSGTYFRNKRARRSIAAAVTLGLTASLLVAPGLGGGVAHATGPAAPGVPTGEVFSPQNLASNDGLYTSSATPTFTAQASDSSGVAVTLAFEVLSGSTVVASGSPSAVASGDSASWTSSTLAAGAYTWQVQASDSGGSSSWSSAQAFTVDTSTPANPVISCSGYPANVWTAVVSGGTTCSWTDSSGDVSGYRWQLDSGPKTWTTGTSFSASPVPGLHSLHVSVENDAGTWNGATYVFGVGSGGITSPLNESTASSNVTLQASAPSGSSTIEFFYEVGTSGSFSAVPAANVTNGGSSVTWPVALNTVTDGVQSPALAWSLGTTVTSDGPVQVEAVFYNSSGGTVATTAPVTVLLSHLGNGQDFATTSLGPVTVGLQSGNAEVSAADVSISAYGSDLAVTRTFNSLQPSVSGLFGPGWDAGFPVLGTTQNWSSVTDDTSYAVLTSTNGSTIMFTTGTTTGGVTSYAGDATALADTLVLTKSSSGFSLTDATRDVTTFIATTGGSVYAPSTVTTPSSAHTAAYIYDGTTTDATYGKPLLMLAPNLEVSGSVSTATACPYPASASTWTAGCRGLAFSYDVTTHNISGINFVAYDGTTFTNTAVASYTYSSGGQLKNEWDPRISPQLKTLYTYVSSGPAAGRISTLSPSEGQASPALASWSLTYDTTSTDANYNKLLTVTRTHSSTYGGATATQTVDYSVPITVATGGPVNMDAATVATWGQSDIPLSAVAVFPATRVPSSPPTATDFTYATIDYYDANGQQVNQATYNGAWNVTTSEYDGFGNTVRTLTAADRATALAAGSNSVAVSEELDTQNLYSTDGTELLDSYGPAFTALEGGILQTIRTHTHDVYDVGAPNSDVAANGQPYRLETSQVETASLGASVPGVSDVDARTTQYVYNNGSDNEGWTLGSPLTTVTDPSGLDIVKTAVYNENSSLYGGEPLQTDADMPSDTAGGTAGDTQTVYYTAGTNSVDSTCGNKPAWADMVCKTEPAAQPGTSGLPSLAVTQYTYNVYLQTLTKTETFGTTGTRTTTYGYDSADRPSTTTVATTGTGMGAALPETKTVYSTTTGMPTDTESLSSTGTVTADLNTTYDDFGQAITYTDASGTESTYAYDIAGRVTSKNDGQGTDTIGYNQSGQPTSEVDSLVGTFDATYDADGDLLTETYPDGTVGTRSIDATGTDTALVYSNPSWTSTISDSIAANAHGDWATQTVLGTSQAYTYDNDDRLTNVQDTQAAGCTTRAYAYDQDSNRTGLTTSAPATGGACQTSTSTTESYSYDAADRLIDIGYSYDTQGDISSTPSVDAGGAGTLTSTYDSTDLLATSAQGGVTTTWTTDPTQTRYSTSTNSATGVTTTNHYVDNGDSPSWTGTSSGAWSRNVLGLDGELVAVDTSSSTTLQLVDLHGDVMATAVTGGTAPTATFTYSETGQVESGTPGAYGWLGGDERSSAAPGGQVLMGVRGYNSNTGRFSQVDSVVGGSANAYDYALQNPITNFDLGGTNNRTGGGCSWGEYWGGCTLYLSNYWTVELVDALNWGAAVGATCAAATWWIPGIDVAVTSACAAIGGALWAASGTIGWINDSGHNVGIELGARWWRAWYWDWGWKATGWHFAGAFIWHQ
jgi:RHS repeat-associated protein